MVLSSMFRGLFLGILVLVCAKVSQPSSLAIEIPVVYKNDLGEDVTKVLRLRYGELISLSRSVNSFLAENNLQDEGFFLKVKEELQNRFSYPDYIFNENFDVGNVTSSREASLRILERISETTPAYSVAKTGHIDDMLDPKHRILFLGNLQAMSRETLTRNPHIDSRALLMEHRKGDGVNGNESHLFRTAVPWFTPSLIPDFIRSQQSIIFYQNRGAYTGGTIALLTLYERVRALGFTNTLMCNDSNAEDLQCTHPSDLSLVITGEWCDGALEDYGPEARAFAGRGVQYHLGFHHRKDLCTGRVTMADSQYLWASFADRGLGAYYFGCEMSPVVKQAYQNLLDVKSPLIHPQSSKLKVSGELKSDNSDEVEERIIKEDLVVFDPDFMRDYPPRALSSLSVPLPPGTALVVAQGIPPSMMPLLLQRAKVVVDLAFPGPERLSGEGVLMGAIPIISNRWNGVSSVDFPGLLKVDPTNITELAEAISYAILNYEQIIFGQHESLLRSADVSVTAESHRQFGGGGAVVMTSEDRSAAIAGGLADFYSYILSMWRRAHFTADVVIGSAHLHFILTAPSLEEEYLCNMQILAILYLFPLASIDFYVSDPVWYARHHYAFFFSLKVAGYVRIDPLDTQEYVHWERPSGGRSYLRIRVLHDLITAVESAASLGGNETTGKSLVAMELAPPWHPIVVFLPKGTVFEDPFLLLEACSALVEDGHISAAEEDPKAASKWMIISPFANLSSSLARYALHLIGDNAMHSSGSLSVGTVHVCSLLQETISSSKDARGSAILTDIVDSVNWRTHTHFIRQTIGYDKLCSAHRKATIS